MTFKEKYPEIYESLHPKTKEMLEKYPDYIWGGDGLLRLPGLMPCPYCNEKCTEIGKTYIAVCSNGHKVRWVPWGG